MGTGGEDQDADPRRTPPAAVDTLDDSGKTEPDGSSAEADRNEVTPTNRYMLATIPASKPIVDQVQPEDALTPEAAAWMDSKPVTAGLVGGHVALSGQVVEHERVYRAGRYTIRDLASRVECSCGLRATHQPG